LGPPTLKLPLRLGTREGSARCSSRHTVCGILPIGSCGDRQEMTLLGLFLLALMGALLGMAALSRI
jgi:hypothetical protein